MAAASVGSPSVWDLFCAVLHPAWVAEWYATHDLHGGGGVFSPLLTLWLLLSQHLGGGLSNEATWAQATRAQLRALSPQSKRVRDGRHSAAPAGYDYARRHLPRSVVEAACDHLFADLHARLGAPPAPELFLLDGSTLSLASTPALAAAFPPAGNQHGDSHWCTVRWVTAHALTTGLAVRPVWGPQHGPQAVGEQELALALAARLPRGAWVAADSNFGVFGVVQGLCTQGLVPLVYLTRVRAQKVAGPGADLSRPGAVYAVRWTPTRDDRRRWPDLPPDACLPGRLAVLALEVRVAGQPEPEHHTAWVFTTDQQASLATLGARAAQRWQIEVDLRSLKHTVGLESLGVRLPEMAVKDLLMGLAAHNVLRWVAAMAAATRGLAPRRISLTRTLHYTRAYAPRLATTRGAAQRQAVWGEMLAAIATCPLPVRDRDSVPRQQWYKRQRYKKRRVAAPVETP